MLAWLLSNGEVDAALVLGRTQRSFDQQLLEAFDKGERERFWQLFRLLTPNDKLQFYLQVYFLIYSIHPSLGRQTTLNKADVDRFKRYLDSRGPQNAQHSDLTDFYALPYVKNPLSHGGYSKLFKKEWIGNLREKIVIYCREELNHLREEAASFQKGSSPDDKELFEQLNHYLERYRALEEQYKGVVEQANQALMDTQNKWFGVTKDLVGCAKSLINMVGQNPRMAFERKFVSLRKKVDRYEKFVSRRLEEMITQSQDISLFDRPSINELSYTMTQYTQKSRIGGGDIDITTFGVDDYVPTNYFRLKEEMAAAADSEHTATILKGLIWRVLRSKDVRIRRLNIIGVLMHDTFGLQTGGFRDLFASAKARIYALRLMLYIGQDYYGRCALFTTGLLGQLITVMKKHRTDLTVLEYSIPILQILSVREDMKMEMIESGIVRFFLQLISAEEQLDDQTMENAVATLLNLCSRAEGIRKFEQQPEALKILAGLLEHEKSRVRVITNGAIYNLLGSKVMHEQALQVGLQEIISYMIEHNSHVSGKDLRCLEERLLKFNPGKPPARPPDEEDDYDEIEEDSMIDWQDQLESIDEYSKAHQLLCSEYQLPRREAQKQTAEVGEIYDLTIQRIHERKQKEKSKHPPKSTFATKSPGKDKPQNKENKSENIFKDRRQTPPKSSAGKSPQIESQLRNEADTAYFAIPPQSSNISEPSRPAAEAAMPRQKLLKRLNEQIRASKFKPAGSNPKPAVNDKAFPFHGQQLRNDQNISVSEIHLRKPQKFGGELDAFAPKPRIARSPSGTPERPRIHY